MRSHILSIIILVGLIPSTASQPARAAGGPLGSFIEECIDWVCSAVRKSDVEKAAPKSKIPDPVVERIDSLKSKWDDLIRDTQYGGLNDPVSRELEMVEKRIEMYERILRSEGKIP